ncbi:ribonuclease H-like domain-containing protein [Tanacetum coccineum]
MYSMMVLEESDMLQQPHGTSSFLNTSSSLTVLVASTTSIDRANTMSTSVLMFVVIFNMALALMGLIVNLYMCHNGGEYENTRFHALFANMAYNFGFHVPRLPNRMSNSVVRIDCDKTFSLIVKLATIRTVLGLAVSQDRPIYQLDVKNAFLHALLQRIIALLQSETDLGSLNYFLAGLSLHDPCDLYFTALKGILDYSAKRQITFSRSNAKVEYHGVVNVVVETAWLRNLLIELHAPLSTATIVYCDNVSVVFLFVCFIHRPGSSMHIFTESLPSALSLEFRSILNARSPLAQTAGEY